MTIQEALADGTRLLKSPCKFALIDTPALDASILLSKILGIDKTKMILSANECIERQVLKDYKILLERRRAGECIAYILGYKEFRGLEFCVNPNVLVPRPDTETLVEATLEHIDYIFSDIKQGSPGYSISNEVSLLDICTGSGAVAISLKNERPFLTVTASDISLQALEIARLNADRLLGKESALGSRSFDFIQSDLFKNIRGKFNIIVSNPPYVLSSELINLAPEVQYEPIVALDGGEDGLQLIKEIIAQTANYLSPGGYLLLEAAHDQMPTIQKLLEIHGLANIKRYKDLASKDRVISGQCPRHKL